MPIPDRTAAKDYHYHAYQYPGDDRAAPYDLSAAQPDRSNYRFYSLKRDLAGLAAEGLDKNVPNLREWNPGISIKADGNDYHTRAITFGNKTNRADAPVVVLTGGIHAREWIAPEITYLIAEYLIKNYNDDPKSDYEKTLQRLIDNRTIIIVPMLNPAGNWYTVFSRDRNARLWRKNRHKLPATGEEWLYAFGGDLEEGRQPSDPITGITVNENTVTFKAPLYPATFPFTYDKITIKTDRTAATGVDCNRNFDTIHWGFVTDTTARNEGYPTSECFFGTNRNSEPETDNLAYFLQGIDRIAASIDYHSYSQLILYPTEGILSEQGRLLGKALQVLIAGSLNPYWFWSYDYQLGTDMELIKYHAVSSVADYMATQKLSRAFTVELDPKDGTFSSEFELPENKIMSVFEKNIRGALGLIAAAGIPDLNVTSGTWKSRHTINTAPVAQFAQWNVFGQGNNLPE